MKKVLLSLSLLAILSSSVVVAQNSQPKGGTFSGSFETNTIGYFEDPLNNPPDGRFGSNNYLKLDYVNRKVAVGVQLEGYYPVTMGLPTQLDGTKIMNKYVTFTDDNFQITAGDFYDQFGNGLIFRAYEDRALGFNNSIEGARVAYNVAGFRAKAFWGRQRSYMEYTKDQVRGADVTLSFSEMFRMPMDLLDIEGSFVSTYHPNPLNQNMPKNVNAVSGRLNLAVGGFVLRSEYVHKGLDEVVDPQTLNKTIERGNALLVDLGYSTQGFGVQLVARRLENMSTLANLTDPVGSSINYIPALTLQSTYALGSLNPYNAFVNEEIGAQLDVYYNVPAGSAVGGRYGMKIHFNASEYHSLAQKNPGDKSQGYKFLAFGDELLWQELNLSIQKTFSRKFKGTVVVGNQKYNPIVQGKFDKGIYNQLYVVADGTVKFNRKNSLRIELQHLWSQEYKGNWAYALVEYSIAPRWSFYASDMYNYGSEDSIDEFDGSKIRKRNNDHYYSVGLSYSKDRTRASLSYGRNRDGFVCSGGVCRQQPAYTGINFTLVSSF